MGRTKTLGSRVSSAASRLKNTSTKDVRITGRTLQAIRFNMWKANPRCNNCGTLTQHPYGYQIDHITPLDEGGQESPANRQLICIDCHSSKTAEEAKKRGKY